MFPDISDIENALLEVLIELGGSDKPKHIYPFVTRKFKKLTEYDLSKTTKNTGKNAWINRLQWTRLRLIENGEMSSPKWGLWKITEKGIKRVRYRAIENTKIPQPFQYQGSKRKIATDILRYFPVDHDILVEPFAGSCAVSVAALHHKKAEYVHLNDNNGPLMTLVDVMINRPNYIIKKYSELWYEQLGKEKLFYNYVRDKFNETKKPEYFLYLLSRCVKGAVRYNNEGEFNQSPDNRRKGKKPENMEKDIRRFSNLLKGNSIVTKLDYKKILNNVDKSNLIYMDPPYMGLSESRDTRYLEIIDHQELINEISKLLEKDIMFILSYDGKRGEKKYGIDLPSHMNLKKININAGRSTQATLNGKNEVTFESLYLSPALLRAQKLIM